MTVVGGVVVGVAADVVDDGATDRPVSIYRWISFRLSALNTDCTSHVATTRARCF